MKISMPKILLIIIFISLIAGHVFAVKEYTIEVENKEAIRFEDLDTLSVKYENYGPVQIIESPIAGREYKLINTEKNIEYENYGPIQIIESPLLGGVSGESINVGDGKNCIFFDNEGIPWQDECLIQVLDPL
jgi:uncharacterized ion transporter superfamily protein YfcC